jgi:hypothetical protein
MQNPAQRSQANWHLLELLTEIFDTVLNKLFDRKESSKLIGEQSEIYDCKRQQYIQRFDSLLN